MPLASVIAPAYGGRLRDLSSVQAHGCLLGCDGIRDG